MTSPPVRPLDGLAGVPRPSVDVSAYLDLDHGLIDRTIFSDRALYQQELRRVFAPSWSASTPTRTCKYVIILFS
jgi:3-phenylpropionate/trans-cinnamate dioxygenase alpha subunit